MTATSITGTPLPLASAIRTLTEEPAPGGGVLSIYLDTSPGRTADRAYLLAFREACRTVRGALAPSSVPAFGAAQAQADAYLMDSFVAHDPGLALFTSGDATYLFAVPMPRAPMEDVTWADAPQIGQLAAAVDDFERIVVVLFDASRARVLTVFLGAIETEQEFRDDVPGKQATGGWYSLRQTRMARHREDHLRRHAERTVRTLMDVLRRHAFDRLLIAGPDEALAVLRRELPRPLRVRLAGQLKLELFAPDNEVLAAVNEAAQTIERHVENELVDELLTDGADAVVGPTGTLAALAEHRVHLLVLAQTFQTPGARCPGCGRLATHLHRCPSCGAATEPLANLREAVIEQARLQGAKLEFVAGPADRRLEEHGGIGAWTRF